MFKSLQWKSRRHSDIKTGHTKYYKFIFIMFWSSNMLCTLPERTNLYPQSQETIPLTLSDVGLGSDMRSKICSWYSFVLHSMNDYITGLCLTLLSEIYQILCFLLEKVYLFVSSHHKFSFINRFTQTLHPLQPTPPPFLLAFSRKIVG